MSWVTREGLRLNIATREFDENRRRGLMICGLNWGGDPDEPPINRPASFFSDLDANPFEYTRKLVRWFRCWGHPLETNSREAGAFERSVVQTNWLPTESPNADGIGIAELVACWDNFELHVRELDPSLIVFLSVSQLDVLNFGQFSGRTRELFGAPRHEPRPVNRTEFDGRSVPNLRAYVQEWERVAIIAVPHPSPRVWAPRGNQDEIYMRSIRDDVFPSIDRFKVILSRNRPGADV